MQDAAALTIDDLLAPFEARPVPHSPEEIAARRRHLAFGWELSRLQGALMNRTWRRLLELHARGQITRSEYRSIGLSLAKTGALRTPDAGCVADAE